MNDSSNYFRKIVDIVANFFLELEKDFEIFDEYLVRGVVGSFLLMSGLEL